MALALPTVVLALLKSVPFFCCGLSHDQEWREEATSLLLEVGCGCLSDEMEGERGERSGERLPAQRRFGRCATRPEIPRRPVDRKLRSPCPVSWRWRSEAEAPGSCLGGRTQAPSEERAASSTLTPQQSPIASPPQKPVARQADRVYCWDIMASAQSKKATVTSCRQSQVHWAALLNCVLMQSQVTSPLGEKHNI